MRTRRRLTWLIFAICILAVLEGLGWVTWHALRLETREREAKAAAQFQGSIRLALWRMESEITPIIAAEAARPYFHYMPFYPAERAYTRMFQQVKPNEVLVPSPLLETSGHYLRLHFQIDPEGAVTSPQAPTGNMRDMAEAHYIDSEYIVLAGQMLDEVCTMVRPQDKRPLVQADLGAAIADRLEASSQIPQREGPPQAAAELSQVDQRQALQEEDSEYKAREKAAQTAQTMNQAETQRRKSQVAGRPDAPSEVAGKQGVAPAKAISPAPSEPPASRELAKELTRPTTTPPTPASKDADAADQGPKSLIRPFQGPGSGGELIRVEQGSFTSHWYTNPHSGEDELVLERSVLIEGKETRQGLWIDWPLLREQLKSSISNLLPTAALCPAIEGSGEAGGQRLAAVPVRLLPGAMPIVPAAIVTPTHVTLTVTWVAVLGAIAAIGVVLRKAMELSERRGRFVSAVTHELRTPLTTFCLYTEMLADGMVTDESARRQYLATLKGESSRLARIVQNVLDYAGIGGIGHGPATPVTPVDVAELVDRLLPALEHCAQRSGMTLVVEQPVPQEAVVRADPQTVERILLNLVENAGKYAGDSTDRRIHFGVRLAKLGKWSTLELTIRDHGPGIPKSERHRIFHAFHRATRDAQGPKSGLGLGLALARELARELGGRLDLDQRVSPGAEFKLTLPVEYRTNCLFQ